MQNELVIVNAPNDDPSCIWLNQHCPAVQALSLQRGDTVKIHTANKDTIGVVLFRSTINAQTCGLCPIVRKNLGVRIGDHVSLRAAEPTYLERIQVAPFADTLENLGPHINLYEIFLKPFFLDAYRPVREGNSFLCVANDMTVEFQVVKVIPGHFGIVSPETVIVCQDQSIFRTTQNTAHTNATNVNSANATNANSKPVQPARVESQSQATAPKSPPNVNSAAAKPLAKPSPSLWSQHITYADIGGCAPELLQLRSHVGLALNHCQIFQTLNLPPPRGILLKGGTGTGKTLIARALANENNSYFFWINPSELATKMFGESEQRLRSAFEEAAKNIPAIVFIDNLDSLCSETTSDVEKRLTSELAVQMDNLPPQVIVLAAATKPDSVKDTLRRAGRFEVEIEVPIPDEKARLEILKIHTAKCTLHPSVDLAHLAEQTLGFVGADLRHLCSMAAQHAILDLATLHQVEDPTELLSPATITNTHFQNAISRVKTFLHRTSENQSKSHVLSPPQMSPPDILPPHSQSALPSRESSIHSSSPQISSPQLLSPQLLSPQLSSPQSSLPQLSSPQLLSPQLSSPQLSFPQLSSAQAQSPLAKPESSVNLNVREKPKQGMKPSEIIHVTSPHHLSRFLYTNPVCMLTTSCSFQQEAPFLGRESEKTLSHFKVDAKTLNTEQTFFSKQGLYEIRNVMIITWLTPINNDGHFVASLNKSRFTAAVFRHTGLRKFVLNIPTAGQETLLTTIGRLHGNVQDKFAHLSLETCKPGWSNPAAEPEYQSQLSNRQFNKRPNFQKNISEELKNNKDNNNHIENLKNNNDNHTNEEFNKKKNFNFNKNNNEIEIFQISKPKLQENLIAINDSCCHLVCEILAIDEFAVDDAHHFLTCRITEAFVKSDYWNGSNFAPQGPHVSPYLTFFGSAKFGYVLKKWDK